MLMIEPHLSIAGGFKKQVKKHFKLKPTPFNLYPNQKSSDGQAHRCFFAP